MVAKPDITPFSGYFRIAGNPGITLRMSNLIPVVYRGQELRPLVEGEVR
jgi:hypothetical protein